MSSKNNEPAFQPFCKGNRVRHKSGIVGTVEACERRVVSGSTRWVVDLQPDDGGKVCPIWAKNCQLVSDGPVWPKFFESTESRGPEYRRRFNAPISYAVWCDGVGVPDQTYEQAIKAVAEGALVEVDENGVEIGKRMEPEEKTPGVTFEPTVAEAVAEVRKDHIELLRQQKIDAEIALQDLVEEMKEHQAEFVRALAAANKANDEARRERDIARTACSGWRSVVVECEKILGMNGATPNDPKISAVPFAVTRLIESKEILQKRIDEAARVLDGKPKQ